MSKTVTLRKGYDINLIGKAAYTLTPQPDLAIIAVKPTDFKSVVPKLMVEVGDEVLAGQPVFFDKNNPAIKVVSPVSGEVVEVVRGAKRRIMEIRIMPDQDERRYVNFTPANPIELSREAIIERLLESGCWSYLRQRPYDLIASPEGHPKGIFVSCFDTAPLAPDLGYVLQQESDNFNTGLAVLAQLASGKLHLSLRPNEKLTEKELAGVPSENIHYFQGPHPAGNVGVQIHHLSPIRKDEVAWYVHPQDVVIIGRLFSEGRYRADRIVALTGSCVEDPQYFRVISGQRLSAILENRLKGERVRIIQGNILTGATSSNEDFLSHYANQITVVPEGDQPEFLGWLLPGVNKLSLSRTYLSWLFPKRNYELDTNMHGEERAFVMTGQYDKVLPMDILPVMLLKAILARDIERMEQLGIYEVSEEDFALCEFVCTSKIDVQRIIAEGLEYVRLEG
ncbi:Na(+)-translocating NADH-quinone reductase subunit A [Telluribacter sp.]|jgi:Na+-transporting NADH:ubiquinone oxidoreductase subunit A|uniref:Na(+)-translocating NADH-quinone reductase subunit A n=1 Tax=Telluribacter sp. TaxID=1978767 RepID=UPI002E12EEEA|nr:Na(+)-translocating NADH-quinone reductase subunit A [Telluribacter sp.]